MNLIVFELYFVRDCDNVPYEKRLTLTDLKFILANRDKNRFEYSYKFYQLNDDDFNFKNLEQILDAEDIISQFPLFQQEWELSKINALHSEQTALFVASFSLSALSPLEISIIFDCFVTYDVATVEEDFCDRLQLYLGAVEVKRTDLYSNNLGITFTGRDIFKDLLVMTATSEFLSLTMTFKKTPNRGLYRFCVEALKFKPVNLGSTSDNQEPPSILYYGDNGYWQAMLIRLDDIKDLRQELKIYCRYSHQILALLQAIYSEYEEECLISLTEDRNTSLLELKDSLRSELTAKIERPSETQEILARELKTDCIYSKLATQ